MVRAKRQKSSEKNQAASSKKKQSTSTKKKTSGLPLEGGPIDFNIVQEVQDYAIFLLDKAGLVMTWNKGAENLKGYTSDEIIGKHYKIFYAKEDRRKRVPEKLLRETAEQGRINLEGWRVKKDGNRFWGNITLTAIHDEEGSLTGFLKVTHDLTTKKVAEEKITNMLEELRLKNEDLKKSEERYHKMVAEVVDYAIILLDTTGNVLDWNKGAEKLKGYTAKEIIGRNFRLFYPKESKDAKLPDQLLSKAKKNGHVRHEGWRIRKDGTRFWGNVVITALHSDDGKVIGYSKVTRDLTHRKIGEDRLNNITEALKQKNQELQRSEERYHKMISEVQDYAILLLDEEGNIENWNEGAAFIKGYTAKEIIGKNIRIFYTPEDRTLKLPEALLSEAVKKGKAIHEGWRVRRDGSKFWGYVVITALHDQRGKLIGFSKVTRDLTDKKKAEDLLRANAAALESSNKALERVNNELSSFTHVASHDMKEPLRKIQSFAARLESDEDLSEGGKVLVEKMKSASRRMTNLIEDLLSYSEVSNDKTKFQLVDLNDVIAAVGNDLELAISEKKATIRVDTLPAVQGIRFQLHQVFLNLVANSLKFANGIEPPVVEISSQVIENCDLPEHLPGVGTCYHIAVKDNGIGFNPDYSVRIFEAFQRLHAKQDFSGTGIGLAIVKKVMTHHHGLVAAEGKPGVGATFHLYFPMEEVRPKIK